MSVSDQTSNIHVLRPVGDLDFYHNHTATLSRQVTPLEAWNLLMGERRPIMRVASSIRDAISARFGVKRIEGFSGQRREAVSVGDRLDFFLVERVEPDCLVLTERDRHLDVMTCISTHGRELTITSSVVTHNCFGRAYMAPVGAAHKLLVADMMKRLQRRLLREHAVDAEGR